MISLVPLLLLAGVVFVEQPINGVEVRFVPHWSDYTITNTRCADLDGDGVNDIVTPTTAAFQRNGQFPKEQQTPLPQFTSEAKADIWKNEIYVLLSDRIEVLRWSKSDWQRTLSQPITWGDAVAGAVFPYGDKQVKPRAVSFERYLCDMNEDNIPEIALVAMDGIHIFSKKGLFYEEAVVWKVLPPLRTYILGGKLWPANAREIAIPDLARLADVNIDKSGVQVEYSVPAGIGTRIYRREFFAMENAEDLALSPAPTITTESSAFDFLVSSANLNKDEIMDFVRSDYAGETTPPWSMPIYETSVSTDAGETFFSTKNLGAEPRRFVTDYNKDGRLDLISENKRLIEGGIRETLLRGLTRREVDLEVEVRLQDDAAKFPSKPSFTHTFTIELDKPPAYQSTMFVNFLQGNLFSLAGDFDGDGICDAAIHDQPNRVSVRKGTSKGISSEVLGSFATAANRSFEIADIDGDGRSDFIVSAGASDETTVYLTRDAAP